MNENKTETNAAHAFVRTAGGYCPEEVDAYIYRITENYADLYRENIILNYQLEELKTMAHVPEGFAENYLEVLRTPDDDRRKQLCHDLVALVGAFLSTEQPQPQEKNFQDLADWYAELSYTWLRIRHYAEANDPIRVHMWGIMLQNELNEVCSDFGLPKMELLSEFDFGDLRPLIARADELEAEMRQHITRGGGVIREYRSAEEFLHEV